MQEEKSQYWEMPQEIFKALVKQNKHQWNLYLKLFIICNFSDDMTSFVFFVLTNIFINRKPWKRREVAQMDVVPSNVKNDRFTILVWKEP